MESTIAAGQYQAACCALAEGHGTFAGCPLFQGNGAAEAMHACSGCRPVGAPGLGSGRTARRIILRRRQLASLSKRCSHQCRDSSPTREVDPCARPGEPRQDDVSRPALPSHCGPGGCEGGISNPSHEQASHDGVSRPDLLPLSGPGGCEGGISNPSQEHLPLDAGAYEEVYDVVREASWISEEAIQEAVGIAEREELRTLLKGWHEMHIMLYDARHERVRMRFVGEEHPADIEEEEGSEEDSLDSDNGTEEDEEPCQEDEDGEHGP